MIVKEIQAKSILSKSQVYPYVINPYVGCQHGCTYCYARFMKRFSGHKEEWGQFVDVKINAAELLKKEIAHKKAATVWISGVCDPYQPLEKKYRLTRQCLEILAQHDWPVAIQTRSPLILRDLDILVQGKHFKAGLSITTADDAVRQIFEPNASSIEERLMALDKMHKAGITTYAMIAPLLPGAELLPEALAGKVDSVIIDRMNYHYGDWVYRKYGMIDKNKDAYFEQTEMILKAAFAKLGIPNRS